jgi:hypothetical protein
MNKILFFLSLFYILCSSDGFAEVSSAKLCGPHSGISDTGYPDGRADADVDGDGCFDYCRVVGNNASDAAIWCTISYGQLKGQTIKSSEHPFDWGYREGRAWIDVNKDGRSDYCRIVGNNHRDSRVACNLSLGNQFGSTLLSNVIDWGYPNLRSFEDCDVNGSIDYCRRVGGLTTSFIGCSSINVGQENLTIPQDFSCKKDDPYREKRGLCTCQWIDQNGRGVGPIGEDFRTCGYYECKDQCFARGSLTGKNLQPDYRGTDDCPGR